jgi:hypothetical protein
MDVFAEMLADLKVSREEVSYSLKPNSLVSVDPAVGRPPHQNHEFLNQLLILPLDFQGCSSGFAKDSSPIGRP